MAEAALWGFVGGSALIIGALLAFYSPPVRRHVGLIMGFGAGVLISAVAYELVGEALRTGHGSLRVGFGFAAGTLMYYLGDVLIARRGGRDKSSGAGASIALGAVLDGIPESVVIGASLIGGGGASIAVVAAVFLSNVPEAVAATDGLTTGGMTRGRIYALWSVITVLTTLSAAVGFAALDGAPETAVAFTQAFAGGAVLTMLVTAMIPEAYEKAGRAVGLMTSLGFAVALLITAVG